MAEHKPRPAPFAIPSTIRVGRATWLILREHELDPVHDAVEKRQLERSHLGFAFPLRKEIHLARHKTERAACETFVHELLHACSSGKISERAEEKFIRDIERRLMGALEQLEWVPRAMRVQRKKAKAKDSMVGKRKYDLEYATMYAGDVVVTEEGYSFAVCANRQDFIVRNRRLIMQDNAIDRYSLEPRRKRK